MIDASVLTNINRVIEQYFTKNTDLTIIPVKELMPDFISAGIFLKDHRKGYPIRQILKELDNEKQLDKIPFAFADRQEKNIYWYFMPLNAPKPKTPYKQDEIISESKAKPSAEHKSDEAYVIGLCNDVLGKKAHRQRKFDFLLGDVHKDGKTKTELPIDAYYEDIKLAIEFKIKEHAESKSKSEKHNKETVSGMPRNEQRIRYDLRKAKVLPEYDITLINIFNSDFNCGDRGKIIRDTENDIKVVRKALQNFMTSD